VAVKIRLKRMGKIRQPYYRVVVVDGRKKRDGKVIEEIGKYHPKQEPSFIEVVSDRAQYWLGVGAQPSEAVEAILKITGDWQRFKGLPGTEGTLRVAEPKRDKSEIFNEALKDAASEPKAGATTARKKTMSSEKAAKADEAPVAPVEEKPEAKAEKKAEKKAEPKAEKKAEAPAAEAAPEAPAEEAVVEDAVAEEAVVETPAEASAAEDVTEATAETTEEAATASTDESADSTDVEATADEKADEKAGA
jgi:small subunit ribosomal protein S16